MATKFRDWCPFVLLGIVCVIVGWSLFLPFNPNQPFTITDAEHVDPGDATKVPQNRGNPVHASLKEGSDTAADVEVAEGILQKSGEQTLSVDNNEKIWIQTLLNSYGSPYLDTRRFKRETNITEPPIETSESPTTAAASNNSSDNRTDCVPYETGWNGNQSVMCIYTSDMASPRGSLARWLVTIAVILACICSACIIYFYCRCRRSGNSDNYRDNPEAMVTVFHSEPPSHPAGLLNNAYAGPYGGHPRAPPGIKEAQFFMKNLEKNPERAAELMFDL